MSDIPDIQTQQEVCVQKLSELSHEDALELARPFRDILKQFEGVDYVVEDGLYVMTEWFLLKRGRCCNSGCRNCPYS
jgi:hypothetical protein